MVLVAGGVCALKLGLSHFGPLGNSTRQVAGGSSLALFRQNVPAQSRCVAMRPVTAFFAFPPVGYHEQQSDMDTVYVTNCILHVVLCPGKPRFGLQHGVLATAAAAPTSGRHLAAQR